jgi:flagellar hook-basal body complex protein FliE
MVEAKIKEVDQLQHQSDETMNEGALKGAEQIHESMIKLDDADLSLRLLIKTRNKALEAYQEIMRMQF